MVSYPMKIRPHYSGMLSGHFPDLPGIVVVGRDHEELGRLALDALEAELERCLARDGELPPCHQTTRAATITTHRF